MFFHFKCKWLKVLPIKFLVFEAPQYLSLYWINWMKYSNFMAFGLWYNFFKLRVGLKILTGHTWPLDWPWLDRQKVIWGENVWRAHCSPGLRVMSTVPARPHSSCILYQSVRTATGCNSYNSIITSVLRYNVSNGCKSTFSLFIFM